MTAPERGPQRSEDRSLPLDAAALDRIESGEVGVGPAVGERLIAQARAALALRAELAAMPKVECACHPGVRWPVDQWGRTCPITKAVAELAECQQKHAACDDCLDNTKAELEQLRGDFGIRINQIALMREEACRYYNADGTFVVMESPEAVIAARKAAAAELAECRAKNSTLEEMGARYRDSVLNVRDDVIDALRAKLAAAEAHAQSSEHAQQQAEQESKSLRAKLALESEARNVAGNMLAETQAKLAQAERNDRSDEQNSEKWRGLWRGCTAKVDELTAKLAQAEQERDELKGSHLALANTMRDAHLSALAASQARERELREALEGK